MAELIESPLHLHASWAACGLLLGLACDADNAGYLHELRAYGAITRAMERYGSTDARFAWVGCGALLLMAKPLASARRGGSGTTGKPLLNDFEHQGKACAALVTACAAHPGDRRVVAAACGAMAVFAGNALLKERLIAKGAVDAVGAALEAQLRAGASEGVIAWCRRVLAVLQA